VNPPSKEQCAYVAGFLVEFGGSRWKRQAMEDVAKYLRSLHEPCPTCGTVGGGGRVVCPMLDDPDRQCFACDPLEITSMTPCIRTDSDDNCTVPCPECGDGGEG